MAARASKQQCDKEEDAAMQSLRWRHKACQLVSPLPGGAAAAPIQSSCDAHQPAVPPAKNDLKPQRALGCRHS